MSFGAFFRRNQGFFNLAIASNVEYRLNYFVDAVVQPTINVAIEVLLWLAIFRNVAGDTVGGFTLDHYLAYALWAAFFSRIAANWMYEWRMIEEIESGTINGILVRPLSFYEYYLSQLMGYKLITTLVSFLLPLLASFYLDWPIDLLRLPLAILLVTYYLILVYSISFLVSCLAFFFNRVGSFTLGKNLALWMLSGELVPLDLVPAPIGEWLIALPFSCGVYVPVAYLTGRIGIDGMWQGFLSVTAGLAIVNVIAAWLWNRGLRAYVGTGA